MLLGCVIGITQIATYNEKGLFYKMYKDMFNKGILLAFNKSILLRKNR